MLPILTLLTLCVTVSAVSKQLQNTVELKGNKETGLLLHAYFYCNSPCQQNMGLNIGVASVMSNAEPPRIIQELVKEQPELTGPGANDVFTAFDATTKLMTIVAGDYPTLGKMTVWASTISGTDFDSMVATPVTAVEIDYPLSSSPTPLCNLRMTVSKVILGPNGTPLVIFSNGEIHKLDANGAKLTLHNKLISDDRAMDVSFPTTLSSHAYDSQRNGLWSVVSAGINAYLVFTDFETNIVGEYLQLNANMKLDPGEDAVTTDFSPEFFINALVIDPYGTGNQLLLQLESLNDIGFDQLVFVNLTTGYFEGPVYNLMEYELVLQCQSYNCDRNRLSAYDPVAKQVYFEAHVDNPDDSSTAGDIAIAALAFDLNVNGKPSYYVWTPIPKTVFGFASYEFYNF